MTAGEVDRAEEWRWGGLWVRRQGDANLEALLSDWPVTRPRHWLKLVNEPLTEKEVERIGTSIERNRPYGSAAWQQDRARELGLLHTLRREGRPKKAPASE